MPNQILFHAYTPQRVAQCRYFLLKYLARYNLKPPAATTITVYTNNLVAFEGFTNFFPQFEMPEVLLHDAAGNGIKTAVLQQAFLQHRGNVLYCDTATYPLQPLEHLFADIEKGNLYLHAPHRHKESELNAALRRFSVQRDKTATAIAAPSEARINVWDAAVVGLSSQHKALLQELAAEEIFQNNLASDYAYTNVFSKSGKIKSADNYIFEYSELKELNPLLEAFFRKNEEESIPNQVKAAQHVDAAAIQQQKVQFRQLPLFKKWLHTITGKRWSIQQYINKL